MHYKYNTNGMRRRSPRVVERRQDSWLDMGPSGLPTFGAMNTINDRVIPCKNPSHAVAMSIVLNRKENSRDWIAFQNKRGGFVTLDAYNVKRTPPNEQIHRCR